MSVFFRSPQLYASRLRICLGSQSSRHFGRYAKYEKPATVRLKYNIQFEGWRKYLVIAYNMGLFKVAKWAVGGYLFWRFRQYTVPLLKWSAVGGVSAFVFMFWFRFFVHRQFGQNAYDKYTLKKFFRTRFELVFLDFDHLSTASLVYLCTKTYMRWLLFRPHRKWIKSTQTFLSTYKPLVYYSGAGFKHGIGVRPLFIENNGQFRGYFKWFIERKGDDMHYGVVDIKCSGNTQARTMTIEEMRLHVDMHHGGEVLKFEPFKVSVDEKWQMQLLTDAYEYSRQSKTSLRDKFQSDSHSPRLRKRKRNVSEADYSIKEE